MIETQSLFPESGAKYAVEHDLMAVLIKLYQEWHHADQKSRYISLRKAILSNIKVCTNYGELVGSLSTHPAFTYSKSTMETPEQYKKYV